MQLTRRAIVLRLSPFAISIAAYGKEEYSRLSSGSIMAQETISEMRVRQELLHNPGPSMCVFSQVYTFPAIPFSDHVFPSRFIPSLHCISILVESCVPRGVSLRFGSLFIDYPRSFPHFSLDFLSRQYSTYRWIFRLFEHRTVRFERSIENYFHSTESSDSFQFHHPRIVNQRSV